MAAAESVAMEENVMMETIMRGTVVILDTQAVGVSMVTSGICLTIFLAVHPKC